MSVKYEAPQWVADDDDDMTFLFSSGEPPPQKLSSFCSELLELRGGANTAFYVRAYVGSIVEP